jgi:hypothetical protein
MSKMAAIDVAVRLQLASERHETNYGVVMGSASAGGAGYGYSESTFATFLLNVANRLRLDTPPWIFSWQALTASNCLADTLALLIAKIETTTARPPVTTPTAGGAS